VLLAYQECRYWLNLNPFEAGVSSNIQIFPFQF
jgi:hypothetical protein